MYLKSLEIHGFKSFPNRTVMTFEPGTTVVVGPNGSGKSNISDAMRWVLGEVSSRNIRGNTMEDVIFNGTADRRSMGYAEVSVCFDNTDPNQRFDCPYDEVTVTRRYYRGGTTEFMINRKPCRRKDVHELFMNTGIGRDGYSIIGQGKVAEMISKKSDERRNIFEEAAGISKFRHRRHEAELKLDATTRNMETTHVQIAMYEEQLIPLEKEAERARRGEAIKEEKKAVDVALWLYDTKKIHEDLEATRIAYQTQKEELDALTFAVEKLYADRAELDEARTRSLFQSEGVLQSINEIREELHRLDSRTGVIATEIGHANMMIAQCEGRRVELQRQLHAAEGEVKALQDTRATLDSDAASLADDKLEALSELQGAMVRIRELEADLADSLKRLEALDTAATELRVRLNVLISAKETDSDKCQALLAEIEEYEIAGEKLRQEAERCERNAAGFKQKIAEQDAIVESCQKDIESCRLEKERLTDEIGALRVQQNTKITRASDLQRMIDQMDGYGRSVKVVMSEYEAGNIRGTIYGPLSSLVTIEREYVTAIETALGSSQQNIVTDTDETAKRAIEALKRTEKGRATFLPVNTIRPGMETDEIRAAKGLKGYVARADKLVGCEDTFRPIVEWLLMRTVVFDTLENAVAAAKTLRHKVRLVTMDGQVMNVGGSMTGGSVKGEGTSLLARNGEIQDLREEAEKIAARILELEAQIKDVEREAADYRTAMADAEQNKELMHSMARTQFSAVDSANARLSANDSLIEKLRADYEALSGMQTINEGEITLKQKQLAETEASIAELRAYREEVNCRLDGQTTERDALQERVQTFEILSAEIVRDVQANDLMMQTALGRRDVILGDMNDEAARIEQYRAQISSLDGESSGNTEQQDALQKRLDALTSERQDLQSSTLQFDKKLTEINEYIKVRENDKANTSRAFYEVQTRFEQLSEQQEKLSVRLHEEYGMSYEDAVAADYPPVTPENEKEMRQTAVSCYNRLRNIGGYSPTAIADYLDIKAKYDEVNDQYVDLKNSFDHLREIIQKLEQEMATTFVTSFEQINENFGVVFRELFGGGTGELSLTDPENVLTSGIEIKAAPPGKKIESLSLLSGGEQAFVAIALFFSILKLHPTPFCILDEVEAALDEVNVFRFGEYIKKFCADTQFILITHRRGTMQIADRLYGVTMPERGISKVICVDIAEIESKKNELTDTD